MTHNHTHLKTDFSHFQPTLFMETAFNCVSGILYFLIERPCIKEAVHQQPCSALQICVTHGLLCVLVH